MAYRFQAIFFADQDVDRDGLGVLRQCSADGPSHAGALDKRLKRQPDAISYGIERRPPGPAPESMKDQF